MNNAHNLEPNSEDIPTKYTIFLISKILIEKNSASGGEKIPIGIFPCA